jgi:hypothetical protein
MPQENSPRFFTCMVKLSGVRYFDVSVQIGVNNFLVTVRTFPLLVRSNPVTFENRLVCCLIITIIPRAAQREKRVQSRYHKPVI